MKSNTNYKIQFWYLKYIFKNTYFKYMYQKYCPSCLCVCAHACVCLCVCIQLRANKPHSSARVLALPVTVPQVITASLSA